MNEEVRSAQSLSAVGWLVRHTKEVAERCSLRNILLAATVLRLGAVAVLHRFHNPVLFEYGTISRNILAGHGYAYYEVQGQPMPSAFMPPAYGYFLALMFRVFGDGTASSFITSQLIHVAMGVLLVYVLYRIARLHWSEGVARASAAAAALYPPFVYMPTEMANINFYLATNAGVFWFLARYLREEPRRRYLVAAGLLLGVLMLFRAEALALVFLLGAGIAWKGRHAWRGALAFALVALAGLVPWTLRNYAVFHRFIPTTTAMPMVLWYGHNPQANGTQRTGAPEFKVFEPPPEMRVKMDKVAPGSDYEVRLHQIYLDEALDYIRRHPREELGLLGKKFFYYWTFDMHHPKARQPEYWVPALLLVALFWAGVGIERRRVFSELYLFAVYILFSMSLALVFHALPRYRMFVEPLMLPFVVQGLLFLAYRFQPAKRPLALPIERSATQP
jgi:4-amino-4-deoxy-L-arabinose transferase-like glycosyltransferase